jgi:hypothetical protein
MFEVLFRVRCGGSPKESTVSDEIDKFLEAKRIRAGQAQDEAQLLRLAITMAPQLFANLSGQLSRSVGRLAGSGEKVKFESQAADGRLPGFISITKDDSYPMFMLRLDRDDTGQPIIHGSQNITPSFDRQSHPTQFTVELVAKSQSQYFYRISGEDCSLEKASGILIRPLLEIL